MRMGFRLRATHETKMNAVSSRSHTVFTINIIQKGILQSAEMRMPAPRAFILN